MSIATELQNYNTYLTNAWNKAEDKGATIPQNKNLQNLTSAIDSIQGGTVIPPEAGTLTSLTLVSDPNKTTYYVGDTIDLEGLQINGNYSNGFTYDVTQNCDYIVNTPLTYSDTYVQASLDSVTLNIPITVLGNPIPAPVSTKALYHFNNTLQNETGGFEFVPQATTTTNYVVGRFGNALFSQAKYQCNEINYNWNTTFLTNNYTMSCWLKLDSSITTIPTKATFFVNAWLCYVGSGTTKWLDSINSGENISLNSNFCTQASNIYHKGFSDITLDITKWNHLAIVFNSGTYKIFINGILITEGTLKTQTGSSTITFSTSNSSNTDYDEFLFCEEALYSIDFDVPIGEYYLYEMQPSENATLDTIQNLNVGLNTKTLNEYVTQITNASFNASNSCASMFKDFTKLVNVNYFNTSGCLDFSSMFENCVELRYTKRYYVGSATNLSKMYKNSGLVKCPSFNTTNCQNYSEMFSGCHNLTDVTLLYTMTNGTNVTNMFYDCPLLTSDSLNTILGLLAGMSNYTGTKTLAEIGLSQTQATTCTTLSNYVSLLSNGWTTGY